jgi:hypothetical protein
VLPRTGALDLRKRVDVLIDHAARLGGGANENSAMINARLPSRGAKRRKVTVILVVVFSEATVRYAALTATRLGDRADVGSLTIDALRSDPIARAKANTADLVVTLVNRRTEVATDLSPVISSRNG